MRILAISLLRVGDLFLAAPALRALKRKYPGATLTVLVNDSSAQGARILVDVDQVVLFPRLLLQSSMADARAPIFQAPQELLRTMRSLVARDFDLVVNLTHNRLSGFISGFFPPEKVLGLRVDAAGRVSFGSSWFAHLDRVALNHGSMTVHYADVFRESCGGDLFVDERDYFVPVTEKVDRDCIRQWPKLSPKRIVIQAVTSDSKKNWSMNGWLEAITEFVNSNADCEFIALAAPSEEHQLAGLQQMLKERRIFLRIAVCTMAEARSILSLADLFVTLDTSIKHLAMDLEVPLVEIALGSSDPYRTGAYRDSCYIIRSRTSCAPCRHSLPCSQSSHLCAQAVTAGLVAQLMDRALTRDYKGIDDLSLSTSQLEIFKGTWAEFGVWQMVPARLEPELPWLGQSLHLLAQIVQLRSGKDELVSSEASTAYQWIRWLRRSFPRAAKSTLRHALSELGRETDALGDEVADARRRFALYLDTQKQSEVPLLGEIRAMSDRVKQISSVAEVKQKILRAAEDWKEETYL